MATQIIDTFQLHGVTWEVMREYRAALDSTEYTIYTTYDHEYWHRQRYDILITDEELVDNGVTSSILNAYAPLTDWEKNRLITEVITDIMSSYMLMCHLNEGGFPWTPVIPAGKADKFYKSLDESLKDA